MAQKPATTTGRWFFEVRKRPLANYCSMLDLHRGLKLQHYCR